MGYQTFSITDLDEIPALVGTYADGIGWTVDVTNPNQPIFTHPTLVGAAAYRLRYALTTGVDRDLIFEPVVAGAKAFIRDPKLNVGGSLVPSNPTTLHLFCALTPEPFIAIAVEYGFNSYRHLYFGYMERLGFVDGGECVAASNAQNISASSGSDPWQDRNHQYLFRGRCSYGNRLQQGGVHIDHVAIVNPFRYFGVQGTINNINDFLDDEVIGGFGDGINDGHVVFGKAPFAGVNVLIPVNLYAIKNPGANMGFVPIGRPAGVRFVNMTDLDPAGQIDVGGDNWRVFPAHRKSTLTSNPYQSGQNWPLSETSYMLGYAYPES